MKLLLARGLLRTRLFSDTEGAARLYALSSSLTLKKHASSRSAENDKEIHRAKVGDLNLEEICRTGNVPERFNFAKDVFDWHASQRPNDTALWMCNEKNEDELWSFARFKNDSLKASVVLEKLLREPILKKKRLPFVLTVLPRIPEWWFFHMGAIRTGAIFCPGTAMLTAEDIEYRLEASSAHLVITNDENVEKFEIAQQRLLKSPNSSRVRNLKKLLITKSDNSNNGDWISYHKMVYEVSHSDIANFKHADTKSEDIAQAFFTSGTTGKPKMVAHSHSSYGIGHIETARQIGLQQNDLFWNISDPGWAKSSYSNFFAPWIAGSAVFIHQMKRFEPKRVLEILRTKPISVLCAPPTLFRSMMPESSQSFKFKSLRYAVGAGEAVNPEVIHGWKEKTGNIPINQMYGQSEFTVLGCQNVGDDKQGSIGKPNGMYEVLITDENGNEVPRGKEGIIALKTKPKHPVGLFKGYLRPGPDGPEWDEKKNSESFLNDVYLTGDKCYMDEDGYMFIVGRADDIINSAGYRIGPYEVESAMLSHPAVLESAAVPSPDSERGEVVKAFIVLNEQFKNSDKDKLAIEIQNHVKKWTAPYKYPRKVEFVESLPKNVSGKILRRELKRKEFEKNGSIGYHIK